MKPSRIYETGRIRLAEYICNIIEHKYYSHIHNTFFPESGTTQSLFLGTGWSKKQAGSQVQLLFD